jgi:hypothetical protein
VLHDISELTNDEEKFQWFIEKAVQVFLERMEKEVPVTGDFKPISVNFVIPGSKNNNTAKYILRPKADDVAQTRTFILGVTVGKSNMLVQHYMKNGSYQEIKEYLMDESRISALGKAVKKLSASADEKADEYPFYP